MVRNTTLTKLTHFLRAHRAALAGLFITLLSLAAASAPPHNPAPDALWQDVKRASLSGYRAESWPVARSFRTLKLNRQAFLRQVNQAPLEAPQTESTTLLTLPLPDGSFVPFRLEESPVMPTSLAAKYPAIKSYRGVAVDNPNLVMRCDWSPRGLHATILSQDQWISLHPLAYDDSDYYVSYYGSEAQQEAESLRCDVDESKHLLLPTNPPTSSFPAENVPTGPLRRTYRLAVATTVEYTNNANLGGGSVATTMATINTWVNALNVIYEREMAVRFMLPNNNDQVIFTAESDGLTGDDNGKMVDEIRAIMVSKLGAGNYDLGQVLSPGSGGVAYIGVVCNDNFKGGGVSRISASTPVGTGYGLITLAHEIGHQFSARHTFSDTLSATCNSSQFPTETAVESFAGLTIMSYAQACTRIVNLTSPHFHGVSFAQMTAFMTNPNLGGSCAVTSNTGNQTPTLNMGADYTIPKQTPFSLTAVGNDPDAGDAPNLTYSWEQADAGMNPPAADGSTGPLFRPFVPAASSARIFPSLTYILNNANVPPDVVAGLKTAETLPSVARALRFICLLRDGRGGVTNGAVTLTVANAGPFLVTAPNAATTWAGGTTNTVTWSVNGTNAAPINCESVRITLSTDGGNTFPLVLAASVPNAGTANVVVPNGLSSAQARLKVEAVGNIFFDLSDTNFTLAPGAMNTAPTVAAAAVTSLQQGSLSQTVNLATVSDAETAAGNLGVTAGPLPLGVGVADLLNVNGTISAQITVGCGVSIGAATIPLTVTDSGGLTTTANVSLNVTMNTPPVLGAYGLATVNLGSSVEFSPFSQQMDNGSIKSLTASAPNFTGTFIVNASTGVVSIGNAGPVGQFIVTIMATDNCEAPSAAQFILHVLQAGAPLEGDVAPRTTGNGAVTIADWTQVGRLVAGLDVILESNEFQRADCAPRATFGDGKLTIADWVQAGRYAAGLDAVVNTAGPTAPVASLQTAVELQPDHTRVVRAMSRSILRGQIASMPLELNAIGNENALGFTVRFDSRWLSFYRATTSSGTILTLNAKQTGQLGVLLAKPTGQTFQAGWQTIATLEFIPHGGAEIITTKLGFGDQLTPRAIADTDAMALSELSFVEADLTISGRAAANVSAASYVGANAASDSIVSAFGAGLATAIQAATTLPLPETLGGTRVTIQDSTGNERPAPLFFVSPNQINYLLPGGLSEGLATVTITNAVGVIARGLLNIERVAPALFTADASGKGWAAADVQRLRTDGSESYDRVATFDWATNRIVGKPLELQANEQSFLLLYGTGWQHRRTLAAVNARIGGLAAEVLYVGPQGRYAGLDQINLRIPQKLKGVGVVIVELEIDGRAANPVSILIQ